jgi:tetratricopeptide (TPR) repeat protein
MIPAEIFNLAQQRHQAGQLLDAADLYRQLLEREPENWQAQFNLAAALRALGRGSDAIDAYRRVLTLKPDFAQAHYGLAKVYQDLGQPKQAVVCLTDALRLGLNFPEGHNRMGTALASVGRLDEAMASFRQALALRPDYAEAQANLGNALLESGDIDGAIAVCERAVELRPDYAPGCNNLASALQAAGRLDESVQYYQKAIALKPDYALAHRNLGLVLLKQGHFQAGWSEHEWRWRAAGYYPPGRELPRPLWDGDDLAGKRILIQPEQGYGDLIQFCRFVRPVAQRGGRVIFRIPPALMRLFHTLEGVERLLAMDQSLPEFDVHCPILSLPPALRSNDFAAHIPYLHPDPALKSKWASRMPTDGRLKIGLRWAGQARHPNDHARSFSASTFSPLAGVAKAWFCSLQKDAAPKTVQNSPGAPEMADWTSELADFADTAALIENLDLVVTADTAVAHLAGAMGKPTWVLLPRVPDWRWMMEREDSPWYPTMRLFRQEQSGDWETPIRKVAALLAGYHPS